MPRSPSPSPNPAGQMPAVSAPPPGVCFPLTGAKRSTTGPAKAVLARALDGGGDSSAGQALRDAKDSAWRFSYVNHFQAVVELMASSPEACLATSHAGLDAAHDLFEFSRDGVTVPLRVAMDGSTYPGTLETGVIKGTGSPGGELVVPYEGRDYCGDDLLELLRAQAIKGTMDQTLCTAIGRLQANPGWLDLSDKYFVLIGATSEMGPLKFLLSHGANVIGIARPSGKWAGLLEAARLGSGTFTYPISGGSEGVDAMKATPELANWLTSLYPEKQLIVASYIYQDGEAFVRASLAMDAIVQALIERRSVAPALVYIDTPSHVHIVPEWCASASTKLYSQRTQWQKALQFVSRSAWCAPVVFNDVEGCPWGKLLAAVSTKQGPNYAIAKQIQRWRAVVSRANGQLVSCNNGPPSRTESVMHAEMVGAAANQLHHFPPNEFYDPPTVCAVMAGLLVRDVCDPTALANPAVTLVHPLQLVADTAWHGGAWAAAFTLDSSGAPAYVIHLLKKYKLPLAAVASISLLYCATLVAGLG